MQAEFNQQAIKHIIESMNDDSLIIFVGAGVSANSGLPNWNQLIDKFRDELFIDDSEKDNLKVAQFYYDMWGQQKYFQKITNIFNEHSSAQPNEIHNHIYKIQPKHIITTNYDTLIEDKLNKGIIKYNIIQHDMDIPYSKSSSYIIKMHGDLKTKNIVLKENDYLDYEKNFYMISTLIKSLIMNNTILFIGYSLGDSTFNSIFRLIHNSFGDNTRKAYFYTPKMPKYPVTEYYRKKGINVLSSGNEDLPNELLGDYTEKFLESISSKKNYKAANPTEIWGNLKFLDRLSFIQSQDIANNINLIDNAFLYSPDNFSFHDRKKRMDLQEDKHLNSLLSNKTLLNSFLGTEIQHSIHFESNKLLTPAFQLYSNNKYSEAKLKFREIANEAYKKNDYYNFLIAEFNVLHINSNQYEEIIELEEKIYDELEFSEILDRIINATQKDIRKIAIFLRDNIFNFNFIFKKTNKINNLLDNFRIESLNYKHGGFSSNNNLSVLQYEFRQFMNFIELNCLCVYQYKEFQLVINKYFESLLIALDNSNHHHDIDSIFVGTSTIIEKIELEDIKLVLPHLDLKLFPVYLDNYSKITLTDDAIDFILNKCIELSQLSDSRVSNSYENLNKYISFLSIVKINNSSKLITLFKLYPLFFNNRTGSKKLLTMILENATNLTLADMKILHESIDSKLELIVRENYEIHFSTFPLYAILLKKIAENHDELYLSLPTFNSNIEIINNINYKLKEIEQYEMFLSSFYNFLKKEESEVVDQILTKYSNLPEEKISLSFLISMILDDVNNFPTMKDIIFNKLIEKINSTFNESSLLFPDPLKSTISNLFNLAQQGYFSFEEILESNIDEKIKGHFPEIDWLLFNKRDVETIEKLMKNRSFSQIKKHFIRETAELKLLNEWALEQFEKNN